MKGSVLSCLLVLWFIPVCAQTAAQEVFICTGGNIRLLAHSDEADSYDWYRDNVLIMDSHGSELIVTSPGTYKSAAKKNGGCISGTSAEVVVSAGKPIALNDTVHIVKNTETVIDVLINDRSPCLALDPASLVQIPSPGHGTVQISGGKFIYKPDPGFQGTDQFSYTIRDLNGQESNLATVTIDISPALPVVLASFTVTKERATALLTWVTAETYNASHFEIQRSADAKSWKLSGVLSVDHIKKEQKNYAFTDSVPVPGVNYYRLKMVDTDGSFSFSTIRYVEFESLPWALIYPNPVHEKLKISIRDRSVQQIRLSDSVGRILSTVPVFSPELMLNMSDYKLGIYFIKALGRNGSYQIFKVIRE